MVRERERAMNVFMLIGVVTVNLVSTGDQGESVESVYY